MITVKEAVTSALIFVIVMMPVSVVAQTEDFVPYTTDHYTIKYPSDWGVTNVTAHSVTFKSPSGNYPVRIIVSMLNVSNDISGIPITISSFRQSGFMISEMDNNSYYLSNHPATRIIGSASNNPNIQVMILLTQFDGMLYSVSYMTSYNGFNTYLPVAQAMINSFQANGTYNRSSSNVPAVNESQINARLNGVVDFCMKSLPVG